MIQNLLIAEINSVYLTYLLLWAKYSHVLLDLGESFHGGDSSLEFLLVDVTGTVGIDLLESGFDGFLVSLADFDIMLFLNLLDESDDLIPRDGPGFISIENCEDILP